MKKIIILLIGLALTGCAQSNYASKKTVISNMTDFLKVNESVCGKYKSSEKKLYGCGTSTSKDFEIAKSKALLNAKVIVSDSLSNSIIKNENQKVKEDTKNGVTREYSSNETNQIFETNLNNYKIVYDKTFVQAGKYRSYIVIEYKLDS
ncbi:hypothetical protein OAW31_03175 [Candidatus Pelagibacter ubique]|jgi:hypothetical protein|nr:hypothetical protein [Candidatus Pelagibacter ubique]MDC3369846.1 hypothetical protein [Candidatus Pelagibacter ubique]